MLRRLLSLGCSVTLLAGGLLPASYPEHDPSLLAPRSAAARPKPAKPPAQRTRKIEYALSLLQVAYTYMEMLRDVGEELPDTLGEARQTPFKPAFFGMLRMLGRDGLQRLILELEDRAEAGKSLSRPLFFNPADFPAVEELTGLENRFGKIEAVAEVDLAYNDPLDFSAVPNLERVSINLNKLIRWTRKERMLEHAYHFIEQTLLDRYFDFPSDPAENEPIGPAEERLSRMLLYFPRSFFTPKNNYWWMQLLASPPHPSELLVKQNDATGDVEMPCWDTETRLNVLRAWSEHAPGWFEQVISWAETGPYQDEAFHFLVRFGWIDAAGQRLSLQKQRLLVARALPQLRRRIPHIRPEQKEWKRLLYRRLKLEGLLRAGENSRLPRALWLLNYDQFNRETTRVRAASPKKYLEFLPYFIFVDEAYRTFLSFFLNRELAPFDQPIVVAGYFFELLFFRKSFAAAALPPEGKEREKLWHWLHALLFDFFHREKQLAPYFDPFWKSLVRDMNNPVPLDPEEERFRAAMRASLNAFEKRRATSKKYVWKNPAARLNPAIAPLFDEVVRLLPLETAL